MWCEHVLKAVIVRGALLVYRGCSKPQTVAGLPLSIAAVLRECNFLLVIVFLKT
jgi:type IV secretory pathway VirB3-like protein